MKKFYLLMMFALLGMVANAAEVVTTSTFKSGSSGVNINSDNLTWTIDKELGYLGFDGSKGVQLGSGSDPVMDGVTLQTAETFNNVKKIEVFLSVAKDGSASISSYVGDVQMGVTTDFSNKDPEVYTFEGGPVSGNISFVLNSKVKAMYVQKVVIYSEEADPTQVATPTFSVEGGEYYNTQSIALSCATADASIFYTINDGVETAYQAPIELNESGEYTIKAWATKEGLENSEVVSKTYTLKIGEQPMNISLNILEYGTDKGLNRGVELYEIVYNNVTFVATKGTNPPAYYEDWRIYKDSEANKGTLTVTAPDGYLIESIDFVGTINFGSADSGTLENKNWTASENTQQVVFGGNTGTTKIESITVTLKEADANQVVAPTFSLTSGTYFKTQELSLSCETEGAKVFYTIDNGEGVSEDREYLEPIQLTNGIYEINAWATKDGFKTSSTVSAIYEIKVIPFEEINVENVKEGKYIIAYNDVETGKSYIMKNEVISDYYVGAEEFDLTTNTPAETDLFVVKQTEGGYTIQNSGNTYVALIQSGKFTNLKPQETDPFVWNFAKSENGNIVATGQGIDSYMSFKMYNTTPEFLAEKNGNYPMFYFVSGTSSVNDAVANEFKAVAVANGIEVNVAEAGLVSVYNAAGQLVANVNVAEGATTINVAAGFYIVKAGNNVAKVLVK
jgi:glycoside hydrolase family 18